MNWDRFNRTVLQYIPRCRKLHPYPEERFFASHLRQEPYAVVPLVRICARGRPQGPSLSRPLGVYRVMAKLNRLALWIRSMCVFLHPGIGENRVGSGNSDRGLSGGSVCRQPKMAETRRADEQTSAAEPHSDLQGEGGIGSNQGREDPVGVGRAV